MVTALRPDAYLSAETTEASWTQEEWQEKGKHEEFLLYGPDGEPYIGIVEPESAPNFEGYYNAYMMGLPGCVSCGTDIRNAKANLQNALELYLAELSQ